MARPHPALIELAAGRPLPPIEEGRALLASAAEHRMQGLLWSRLETGEIRLDAHLERDLAAMSLLTEVRHGRLAEALGVLAGEAGSAGIEIATFKGITAEQRWYDRVGERPCWDVDLLLAPHHLSRAGELVELLQPDHSLGGREVQRLVDAGALQSIDLLFNGVLIDLHFDLFRLGYPSRRPDVIWSRTEWVRLADGRKVRALDAEMSLVFLLFHLNRDRFARVLGYVDVLRIIQREAVDWDFIHRFVEGEGLAVQYSLALAAVLDSLGIETPVVEDQSGWRAAAWRFLWRPSVRLRGEEARVRFTRRGVFLLPFLIHGRSVDAARYLLHRMFPPRAKVDLLHPGTHGPYLWRLLSARVGHITRRLQRLQGLRRRPANRREPRNE